MMHELAPTRPSFETPDIPFILRVAKRRHEGPREYRAPQDEGGVSRMGGAQ